MIWSALVLLAAAPTERIVEVLDVGPVWAGHPVGFHLLHAGGKQFVGFYDADRRMTVAERALDQSTWTITKLDSHVVWDSHNNITMTTDDQGLLHLAGNMHGVPLIYFRSEQPHDSTTLRRVPEMIGREERRVTYPSFFRGPGDALYFTYRDGGSGDGNQLYNRWDPATTSWTRVVDGPIVHGEGQRNAYLSTPMRGPDGLWHLVWVWRETPDCATNHDPSYARSPDLVHWTRSDGTPIPAPITLATGEVVDPVPVGGGVINGNLQLGWDTARRPIVSYHKYDAAGATQICNARLEDGVWRVYQTSDWTYRWNFSGGGSIAFEIRVGPVQIERDGSLSQSWRHSQLGSGVWRLDAATLKPTGLIERVDPTPPELRRVESDFPGMQVHLTGGTGRVGEAGVRYLLRWETLGANRDRPREQVPPPSMLRVYKLKAE